MTRINKIVSVKDMIKTKLEAAFSPSLLEVVDESHLHAGHGGMAAWQEVQKRERLGVEDFGSQSHFRVTMRAESLAGKSRIAIHRSIHEALGPELISSIHALALDVRAD